MQKITIKTGPTFGKIVVVVGYTLILLAVFLLFVGLSGGDERISAVFYSVVIPLMLFIGIIISFFNNRIKIDFKKETIFTYAHFFGLKLGKKETLNKYQSISIRTKKIKDLLEQTAKTSLRAKHDIVLLSVNKNEELILTKIANYREARDFTLQMAKLLKKPLVKYKV